MKYYKDSSNNVFALDDACPVDFPGLPNSLTEISKAVAQKLSAPKPPTPEEERINEIVALELTITPRRFREAVLGIDGGWLESVNNQIAALRSA